ncbi:MAG: hypothetical protein JO116_22400 [Planctomycetaceae bacterium]|nr:hypothetical protein [Planctomycetaceae bacterium]
MHSSFQPATLPRLDIKRFQVSGTVNKPPMAKADHVCLGLDFHDITPPYIMKADDKAWRCVPSGARKKTEDGQAAKPKESADLNFHLFPRAGLNVTRF